MPPQQSPEAGRTQPEAPSAGTQERLDQLKEQISRGQMDAAIDTLIEFAGANDEVLGAASESFVRSLSGEELKKVVDFLSGNEDPTKAALRSKLDALRAEIEGTEATPETASETPVQRILGAIDRGIERAGISGKLSEIAAKFGFKGEVGPKQVAFVKNMLVGFAARTIEGMILAVRRINPSMDVSAMMNTTLELRLMSITDPAQREQYKEAYLAWAKNPTTPNPPTLQEVLNGTATPAEPVAEAPSQEPPAVIPPEIVDSTRILTFVDGTPNLEFLRQDGKTFLTTDGKKAEMKVQNLQTVATRAPTEQDPGLIEMKLADGRTVSTVPADLRNAVRDSRTELLTSESDVKIELTEIQNA